MNIHITQGDCIEKMKELADDSFDSIVTDPPYGINFMGKEWDGPQGMVRQMATGDEQRGAYAYGGSHSRGYADNDNVLFQHWCETWLTESLRVQVDIPSVVDSAERATLSVGPVGVVEIVDYLRLPQRAQIFGFVSHRLSPQTVLTFQSWQPEQFPSQPTNQPAHPHGQEWLPGTATS